MDIQTLLISNGANLLLYFVALVVITAFGANAGMKWFAASYGFLAAGTILVAARGHISLFLSILVGNTFIFLGFTLQHKGALAFMEEGRRYLSLVYALLLIAVLGLAYFTYVKPSTEDRILVISAYLAILMALTATVLLPGSKGIPSRRVIAGICAFNSALNVVRGIGTAYLGAPQNFLERNNFQILSLLLSNLANTALLLGFTWMVNARLQSELEYAANMDSLTGVMNRRAMEATLKKEIRRSRASHRPLTFFILDIDHFKKINDTRGHAAGDEVLKQVAQTLVDELRIDDHVSRWGGEEFCCLLPRTVLVQGIEVAERLRECLEAMEIGLDGDRGFRLTVSIGVAELKSEDTSFSLIRRADEALYKAKRSGRNQVCWKETNSPEFRKGALSTL